MRRAINESIGLLAECFDVPGPVVEIGALYAPGAERLGDLRRYFPGRTYIGCDIRHGRGVDRIEDAQRLTFSDASVGAVLLFEILEHLPHPDRAIAEAHRVLTDAGVLALSVPFNYRLHGFPSDYWRFTASGIHSLLEAFDDKVVVAIGPRVRPAFVLAVAAKRAQPAFERGKARFTAAVRTHFGRHRLRGAWSELKERSRDLAGLLLGRAHIEVRIFDPAASGGYEPHQSSEPDFIA